MEQTNLNQDSLVFSLQVDSSVLSYLSATARWGKFLSIVGFIACGLMLIAGLALPAILSKISPLLYTGFMGSIGLGTIFFIYIVLAIVYFFPCLYLFRFSSRMQRAIATEEQHILAESFKNLKGLFRYLGICTIVVLSFYALAILGALIAGVMR